jgi:hypothetical protein
VSAYNAEYNKDLSYIRHIIVALLNELNNKIYFYNVLDEDTKHKIDIPFYYSVTGQERFLLDNFLFDAQAEGKVIGDYERVPRGVIQLESASIDSSALINKFVRTQIIRPYKGQLKTFALSTQAIPLSLNFNTTVVVNNNLELFKVTEALISRLYKNNLFYVDYGGFQAQSNFSLPEDLAQDMLFEYGFTDRKEYKVSFPLMVNSFLYVFEDGLQLAEIPMQVVETSNNSQLAGIGVYNGSGIYFGNVMETIESTIDDYKKAPYSEGEASNQGYNNLADPTGGFSPTGPVYAETTVSPPDTRNIESSESKEYRNDNNSNPQTL